MRVAYAALFTVLAVAAAAYGFVLAGGGKVWAEASGSMAPTLMPGDLVVTQAVPVTDVQVGMIATFPDAQGSITHRVAEIVPGRDGMVTVVTKGDQNVSPETWLIASGDTVQVVARTVPLVAAPAVLVRHAGTWAGVLLGLAAFSVWQVSRRQPCP